MNIAPINIFEDLRAIYFRYSICYSIVDARFNKWDDKKDRLHCLQFVMLEFGLPVWAIRIEPRSLNWYRVGWWPSLGAWYSCQLPWFIGELHYRESWIMPIFFMYKAFDQFPGVHSFHLATVLILHVLNSRILFSQYRYIYILHNTLMFSRPRGFSVCLDRRKGSLPRARCQPQRNEQQNLPTL